MSEPDATPRIEGIHHITAIASGPQPNIDFYSGFLGLRLVKRTVNFDDPGTYHFYYGDETGQPGTILTFFPWPGTRRGRIGTGQVSMITFAAPKHSLPFWNDRAKQFGIQSSDGESLGERRLALSDPDGLPLEIVASLDGPLSARKQANIPSEHALAGFQSATVSLEGYERTARLLTDTMGFRLSQQEGARYRFSIDGGGIATTVDLVCAPDGAHGLSGAGTVHHMAWRTPDDASQVAWQKRLASLGYNVTPIMDRNYFRSIYFREPGGVLFEIATDPPGFLIDEPLDQLGMSLKLPQQYEPIRARIEQVLPEIKLP